MATANDFRELNKIRKILAVVAEECEPDMPLSYLRILTELMLAHLEGGEARTALTMRDLLDRTGAEQSSLSRAVAAMTDQRKAIAASPYHVAESYPDPRDRRYRIVRLNDKGVVLLGKIITALEAAY